MKIRAASTQDAPYISELVASLSQVYLGAGQTELPEWFVMGLSPAAFTRRLSIDNNFNLVCEHDHQVIGYISLTFNDASNSHLFHLFVDQAFQRQGIARQLWQEAMQQCVSAQYTVRASLNAVPVYAALGFEPVAEADEKGGIHFQAMQLQK